MGHSIISPVAKKYDVVCKTLMYEVREVKYEQEEQHQ